MFCCRGIGDGVKPAAGSVFGAVLSSVEIQAPSIHLLVFVIFSLMDSRSPLASLHGRSETAAFAVTYFGRPSGGFLAPAGGGPVAHALHVFFCVVSVAIAIPQCGRKKPRASPFLSHSIEIPSSRAASEIL